MAFDHANVLNKNVDFGKQELVHLIKLNRYSENHESEVGHFNTLMKLRYAE